MKKVILIVLALAVVGVGVLGAVIASQPEDFTISRSAAYAAPPERIFAQINDFHNWNSWSPWAKLDPQMKTTISGPASGVGSSYAWAGNSSVGEGKMTIIESRPNESVKIDLEFLEPFAVRNLTEFTLKPEGDKTNVVWTMSGKNGFLAKAMCMVIDMDTMMGPDFEKGLAQMKQVVETK